MRCVKGGSPWIGQLLFPLKIRRGENADGFVLRRLEHIWTDSWRPSIGTIFVSAEMAGHSGKGIRFRLARG